MRGRSRVLKSFSRQGIKHKLTKNAMTLKEINSNEEPNAGGRQLHMLLSNETTPCSGHVSTNNQHSKRYKRY